MLLNLISEVANMNSIESILLSLESKCRMGISEPASKEDITNIAKLYPEQFKAIKKLYEISDGIEIDVPGTVLYPINKIISINEGLTIDECIEIGVMNFGDIIAINSEGKVIQLEHESGKVFLDWDSIEDFLNDELSALE